MTGGEKKPSEVGLDLDGMKFFIAGTVLSVPICVRGKTYWPLFVGSVAGTALDAFVAWRK